MLTEILFVVVLSSSKAIEPFWRWCCEKSSPYAMFVIGCFLGQVFAYAIGCIPFLVMDLLHVKPAPAYKIQKKRYPTAAEMRTVTKQVLISFVIVVLPMLVVGGFVLPHMGISRDGPLPPWYIVLVHIAFFFVVEDYLNYWIHRWLHTPWLYRKVHSVHHYYNAPFSIVSAHAHPFEIIVLAIPTFVGPLAISPHLYTLMVWQLFRNFEAIDIHSGYELPYSLKTLLPAYAGADHHDYHHYMHSGNFASVFTWCDTIYGTDLGYKNYKLRRKDK